MVAWEEATVCLTYRFLLVAFSTSIFLGPMLMSVWFIHAYSLCLSGSVTRSMLIQCVLVLGKVKIYPEWVSLFILVLFISCLSFMLEFKLIVWGTIHNWEVLLSLPHWNGWTLLKNINSEFSSEGELDGHWTISYVTSKSVWIHMAFSSVIETHKHPQVTYSEPAHPCRSLEDKKAEQKMVIIKWRNRN